MKQSIFHFALLFAPAVHGESDFITVLDYYGPAWSPYLVGALIGILG